ncbi:hypothetical protein OCU04_013055 [Sclerotinia nivalis]|uniref:Uncharacterized protein n=1 Tax=Sclerotinia nivalis TaxID=352851 RepID=A0A9X0DC21_9HELO|nr:hypothetical protein OCU04_013055 [Sclerotinia nivalis]
MTDCSPLEHTDQTNSSHSQSSSLNSLGSFKSEHWQTATIANPLFASKDMATSLDGRFCGTDSPGFPFLCDNFQFDQEIDALMFSDNTALSPCFTEIDLLYCVVL